MPFLFNPIEQSKIVVVPHKVLCDHVLSWDPNSSQPFSALWGSLLPGVPEEIPDTRLCMFSFPFANVSTLDLLSSTFTLLCNKWPFLREAFLGVYQFRMLMPSIFLHDNAHSMSQSQYWAISSMKLVALMSLSERLDQSLVLYRHWIVDGSVGQLSISCHPTAIK